MRRLTVEYAPLLKELTIGSAAFFVLTPVLIPILIVLMPPDILVRRPGMPRNRTRKRRILFLLRHLVKNLIGISFMLLGVLLLFLPGQGILTLFFGLLLTDVPGKKPLLSRLLGSGKVRPIVERLRSRCKRPSMIFPIGSSEVCRGEGYEEP